MKKILSLTLSLAMLGTALTGCGPKDAVTQTPAENTQQTVPVQHRARPKRRWHSSTPLPPAIRTPPAAC